MSFLTIYDIQTFVIFFFLCLSSKHIQSVLRWSDKWNIFCPIEYCNSFCFFYRLQYSWHLFKMFFNLKNVKLKHFLFGIKKNQNSNLVKTKDKNFRQKKSFKMTVYYLWYLKFSEFSYEITFPHKNTIQHRYMMFYFFDWIVRKN